MRKRDSRSGEGREGEGGWKSGTVKGVVEVTVWLNASHEINVRTAPTAGLRCQPSIENVQKISRKRLLRRWRRLSISEGTVSRRVLKRSVEKNNRGRGRALINRFLRSTALKQNKELLFREEDWVNRTRFEKNKERGIGSKSRNSNPKRKK